MSTALANGWASWALAGTLGVVMTASASVFDGDTNLVCTATEVYECDASHACRVLDHDDAHDVRHLSVDFRGKTVTLDHIASAHVSKIDRVETVDRKLIVQGIEDGRANESDGAGWTLSVDARYGTMAFTVAGASYAFVGLGGCAPAD